MGSTFRLNKAGIKRIRSSLRSMCANSMAALAKEAYVFFVNFGYHRGIGYTPTWGDPEPWRPDFRGYTHYMASNWNCGIGSPKETVHRPKRPWRGSLTGKMSKREKLVTYGGSVDFDYSRFMAAIQRFRFGKSIFITNSTTYAQKLNNGSSSFNMDFKWIGPPCLPNRFIEQCLEFIAVHSGRIVKEATEGMEI